MSSFDKSQEQKRKNQRLYGGSCKKRKGLSAEDSAEDDLRNWNREPRGMDVPQGLVSNWLKIHEGCLVIAPTPSTNNQTPRPLVLTGCHIQYDISSQVPAITVSKSDYTINFRAENVQKPDKLNEEVVFSHHALSLQDSLDPDVFTGVMKTRHWNPFLQNSQVETIVCFCMDGAAIQTPQDMAVSALQDHDEQDSMTASILKARFDESKAVTEAKGRLGLHLLSFRPNKASSFWYDTKPEAGKEDPELENLLKVLNLADGVSSITIVRAAESVNMVIHRHWLEVMEQCVWHGVWSYYNKDISREDICLFKSYILDPQKILGHQVWMKIPGSPRGSGTKFASHTPRKSFGSMHDFEIVQSAIVMYKRMCQKRDQSNIQPDQAYEARVKVALGGYVMVEVAAVEYGDVAPGAQFKVRKVRRTADPAVLQYEHNQCLGVAINMPTEEERLVISFWVKQDDEFCYVPGQTVLVTLRMRKEANPPAVRQLKAIARICRQAPKSCTDVTEQRIQKLHEFVKGAGAQEVEGGTTWKERAWKHRLTDAEKLRFNHFHRSLDLDCSRQKLWDGVFDHSHFVVQVQDSPGTSTAHTVSSIAVPMALLYIRTVLCARTKCAAKKCLRSVVRHYESLNAAFPDRANDMNIVYVPSLSVNVPCLQDLVKQNAMLAVYNVVHETGADDLDRDREYTLHSHVLRSFQQRSEAGEGKFEIAADWLEAYHAVKSGGGLAQMTAEDFVVLFLQEVHRVLFSRRTRLVISTYSDADVLAEFAFKPYGLLIDDCAAASEAESCVPLSLGAGINILVGDHRGAKPRVDTRGSSEFADQEALSLFERHYGRPDIPLFHLTTDHQDVGVKTEASEPSEDDADTWIGDMLLKKLNGVC